MLDAEMTELPAGLALVLTGSAGPELPPELKAYAMTPTVDKSATSRAPRFTVDRPRMALSHSLAVGATDVTRLPPFVANLWRVFAKVLLTASRTAANGSASLAAVR